MGQAFGQTIPVYDFAGLLTESGQVESNLLALDLSPQRPLTHFDIVMSLKEALVDEEVPAVVLEVDQTSLAMPQIEEMSRLLGELKAAGKEVWLYSDSLDFRTALLGSQATAFVLNPEGNVSLNGLYSETLYFKGLLDHMGVAVDVVHIGDFKSAGENFYRTGPSQAAEQQSDLLLDSLYDSLLSQIAKGRGIERAALVAFIEKGSATAKEAEAAQLVDRLQSRSDLVTALREKYGEESRFERGYVRKGEKVPEVKSFFDLMKIVFPAKENQKQKEDYIAVVAFEGAIDFESIAPVRSEVLKLVDDEKCAALVLRVNSPGGSALASEILWEALDEFNESERPFVVSMGAVAASGGYYIASAADRILAEPTTITGSIGVVGMKVALGDMMSKVGITTHESKRGAHADLYNSTRPFSEQERGILRDSMLDVYRTFLKRVTDGRGEKLQDELEKLAGGRVYSGTDALAVGLVDELGGLGEAIALARSLAEVESAKAVLLPKPVSALDSLFERSEDRVSGDQFITLDSGTAVGLSLDSWWQQHATLGLLPTDKADQIRLHLHRLKSLQKDRIQLIAPPLPSF